MRESSISTVRKAWLPLRPATCYHLWPARSARQCEDRYTTWIARLAISWAPAPLSSCRIYCLSTTANSQRQRSDQEGNRSGNPHTGQSIWSWVSAVMRIRRLTPVFTRGRSPLGEDRRVEHLVGLHRRPRSSFSNLLRRPRALCCCISSGTVNCTDSRSASMESTMASQP